ncbi:MAG: WXG100 family type VII secretion target [Lachnospiraceae bacterium]
MALIQVTPDLLTGKAAELRGIKSEHDEAMAKMRTLILGLNEIWKGDAQDAFVAKYESMQSTFTNFSQMIEEYAKLMDTAANELGTKDQELQAKMNSFGE